MTEIKSQNDDFNKAFSQLNKVKQFSNKVYIATNKDTKYIDLQNWKDDNVGLLIIRKNDVYELKSAKKLSVLSDKNYISKLRKKCLVKLCNLLGIPSYLTKKEIEERLRSKFVEEDLKNIVQQIVICNEDCIENCILDPYLIEATASIRAR